MSGSVIKSFLVKLGFQSDESALKRFSGGIEQATKVVVGLAVAVEAAASAVAIGVYKFANNLEALYFAAQRTGASATNLRAFSLAMQNFGVTAGESLGSVEALASFLRNNPGGEGLLRSLGLQTRDPKSGQLRDTTDMMLEFGRATAKMPFYLANQYASILGISERTLLALRNGDFEAELRRRETQLANVGFKKATEDAHKFMEQLRDAVPLSKNSSSSLLMQLRRSFGFSIEEADAVA